MPNRRRTKWEDTHIATTIAAGATSLGVAIDGTPSGDDAQGLTLTRMLGELSFMSTTVAGAWGVQVLTMGVGGSSRVAFTADSLPTPNSNVEQPPRGWVWKTSVAVAQNGAGAPVVMERVHFDIRAQRKLDGGRLWIVFVNVNLQGTSASVLVSGLIRVLFLLP